jgi:DNA-binding LacI/PurR family transcriptional regulator
MLSKQIIARKIRPTRIVAMNNMMATGFILGLQSYGLRVPEDVSVVDIDDMFLSAIIRTEITSVKLPLREMAKPWRTGLFIGLIIHMQKPKSSYFYPQLTSRFGGYRH